MIDWKRLSTDWLPFADAATAELPLKRLLRLGLFQISVAMTAVLLVGTLNRVMIVELHFPAWVVATLVAVPLLLAPLRAVIGFKSDHHRSVLGWRRVPYLWFGALLQFGGLAVMPFALIILSGMTDAPRIAGEIGCALAFVAVGLGVHTVQTAGLALATDLAPAESRPRVVALLYMLLLVGAFVSALVYGRLLTDFTPLKLVQLIQGVAVTTMVLNLVALWKQETRHSAPVVADIGFVAEWRGFLAHGRAARLLTAIALGSAGFQMQDVLIEPYGGELLGLSVSSTTLLTAFGAAGALAAFALAARHLGRGVEPGRLAGIGVLVGVCALVAVMMSAPLGLAPLLAVGVGGIGFGGGLFSVGTLIAAMNLARGPDAGLALGAWGAAQATAAGAAILASGALRDLIHRWADMGLMGPAVAGAGAGYAAVYGVEIILLFGALVAVGPLARRIPTADSTFAPRFGLAELRTQ